MKAFRCRVCEAALFFENSRCIACGATLGFSRVERAIVPLDDEGRHVDADGAIWHRCANRGLTGCTWLTSTPGGECDACALTRRRPADDDAEGRSQLPAAEQAKRHLIYELDTLGFALVGRDDDPEGGLAFDLLSSVEENVVIGHAGGVITIDLAESDDARREQVRLDLGEPYRTMLGHLRHEIGHYLQSRLVRSGEVQERCRELFGDERADYGAALKRHYDAGPPQGWERDFISGYATMHPFEDFAETCAHYLHISDTVETAAEQGLLAVNPSAFGSFRDLVVGVWVPLSVALNQINRSMGNDDLYPFVIPAPVLDKLDFVASLAGAGAGSPKGQQ